MIENVGDSPTAIHGDRVASTLGKAIREIDAHTGAVVRTIEISEPVSALALHAGVIAVATPAARVTFLAT